MTDEKLSTPLNQDRSFWGMTLTQFFGAFNDNLFKMLLLLLCVDYANKVNGNVGEYQFYAQIMFALPFVLFSGFAGFLSDRYSKRRIVVLCKVGEILVMLAGLAAFFSPEIVPLYVVMFLMSTQSAFFGPSKYGILPEMLDSAKLPAANGIIQLTTFLAIIFGGALAGHMKEWFAPNVWPISAACVVVALVGTGTSMLIRPTPTARPGLPFKAEMLAINREMIRLLWADSKLLIALLMSSLFWFLGGVVQQIVTAYGKEQLAIGDAATSNLFVATALGIGVGCGLSGFFSKNRVRFGLVRIGAWGIIVSFVLLAAIGANVESIGSMNTVVILSSIALLLQGVFSGLFIVPIQVFLQARPPAEKKGQMIGTMNLTNWIGILLSAGFYIACYATIAELFPQRAPVTISWSFLATAIIMLPVALLYRPDDEQLENTTSDDC
ncbi:MAG: MFS transporter [Planctomycetaceae bacterium]|nr:MFS transporter [Planctomycetaceae bacterium]